MSYDSNYVHCRLMKQTGVVDKSLVSKINLINGGA